MPRAATRGRLEGGSRGRGGGGAGAANVSQATGSFGCRWVRSYTCRSRVLNFRTVLHRANVSVFDEGIDNRRGERMPGTVLALARGSNDLALRRLC